MAGITIICESFFKRKLAREPKGSEDTGFSNKCPFRNYNERGGAWLDWKGTRHKWSRPEAKAGTRLRDGCYGNRRQTSLLKEESSKKLVANTYSYVAAGQFDSIREDEHRATNIGFHGRDGGGGKGRTQNKARGR